MYKFREETLKAIEVVSRIDSGRIVIDIESSVNNLTTAIINGLPVDIVYMSRDEIGVDCPIGYRSVAILSALYNMLKCEELDRCDNIGMLEDIKVHIRTTTRSEDVKILEETLDALYNEGFGI